jgi:predicted permease
MNTILQDLRFAFRSFARRPSFLLTAVFSLGLGIGLNATVFTWFKAVYLNPLPGVTNARDLATISAAFRDGNGYSNSYSDFVYFRDHSSLFSGLFAHEMLMLALSDGRSAELTTGGIASGNYFDVLGTRMSLGRGFRSQEDEVLDRNPVIVLSHSLWQRRFSSDRNIVGRQVELNRTPLTVVGVAPPGFIGVYGGIRQDFWVPMHMARALDAKGRNVLAAGSWLQIMGRPKPGVSLSTIQAELDVLASHIRAETRKDHTDYRAQVYPLHRSQRGFHSGLFEMVRILAVAVGLILLLSCLNVANLLIARATDRSREMSVRLSLGASRSRILRQLLTESALLALLGGSVGLVIAFWSRSAPQLLTPGTIELYLNLGVDWTVIAFLFGVSLVAAALFGIVPAIETTRLNLVAGLKEGAASVTSGRRRNVWRSSLVVGQVALSMAALVGAALFAQRLFKIVNADRGFQSQKMLAAQVDLFAAGIDESRGRLFYRSAIDQLQALPQVESAAWTSFLPMSGSGGGNRRAVEVRGYASQDGKPLSVTVDRITPGYLRTLGIPMVKGREFEWSDEKTTMPVLLVNQKFVDEYLKGRDPVGAAVRVGGEWRTVVGVHRNYIYRSPNQPPGPTIFLPFAQDYSAGAIVVVRTKSDPSLVAIPLRQVVLGFDRNIPVSGMMTMEQNVGYRFAETRVTTGVLTVFGLLALTLAAIGLYGVLATFVNQRRREFGVRSALGATPGELRSLVFMESARLTLIGLGLGLLLSIAFAQVLRSMLEGLNSFHPLVYAAGALGVAMMAIVSTLVPSRSAARMDPMIALRSE